MNTTLAGFGGGLRGEGMAWPETAPTEKYSLFMRDPRVFFSHAAHARPPSGH
jgi:hypothetical protein